MKWCELSADDRIKIICAVRAGIRGDILLNDKTWYRIRRPRAGRLA
jgi:hypothetical protein